MIVKSSEFGVNSQKLQYFYDNTKPLQNCTNTMVVFWLKSARHCFIMIEDSLYM